MSTLATVGLILLLLVVAGVVAAVVLLRGRGGATDEIPDGTSIAPRTVADLLHHRAGAATAGPAAGPDPAAPVGDVEPAEETVQSGEPASAGGPAFAGGRALPGSPAFAGGSEEDVPGEAPEVRATAVHAEPGHPAVLPADTVDPGAVDPRAVDPGAGSGDGPAGSGSSDRDGSADSDQDRRERLAALEDVDAGPVGPPWSRGFVDGKPVESAPRPSRRPGRPTEQRPESRTDRRTAVDPELVARVTSVQPMQHTGVEGKTASRGIVSPAVAEAVARAEAAQRNAAEAEQRAEARVLAQRPEVSAPEQDAPLSVPSEPVRADAAPEPDVVPDAVPDSAPDAVPDSAPDSVPDSAEVPAPREPAAGSGDEPAATRPMLMAIAGGAGALGIVRSSADDRAEGDQAEGDRAGEDAGRDPQVAPRGVVRLHAVPATPPPARPDAEDVPLVVTPADGAQPSEPADHVDAEAHVAGPAADGPAEVRVAEVPVADRAAEDRAAEDRATDGPAAEDVTEDEPCPEAEDHRAAEHAAVDLALLRTLGFADPNPRPGAIPVVDMSGFDDEPDIDDACGEDASPVRFHVVRRDGMPVVDAGVTLLDARGREAAGAASDVEGRGVVVAPHPGAYVLVSSARGHQPGVAALSVGAGPLDVEVLLTRSGSIVGVVRGPGSAPVAAASVTLLQDGELVAATESAATGSYRFDDLAAGEYTLTAMAAQHVPAVGTVRLPEETEVEQDVELARTDPAVTVSAEEPATSSPQAG
ncbi:MAG: carboxypeptidase regulatory-like domain-containing protein [Pseudonocardia sp.]|nr:carboxypeptidase regulatory-like domain-containing protein [Pseudonocardia sp.]